MTEHLPECPWTPHDCDEDMCERCDRGCYCNELRACEQRVRNQDIATHHADLKEAKALLASRDEAWFAGVDAAREAVAALPEYRMRDACIAAIEALRRKENDEAG